MRTMCSREIFTKKCQQQQIFDSDLKGAWHYNHVTFTPIASKFMLYCRLIYMLSILCVRLTIKVKVGIPESFKVGWYPPKKTGSSHLNNVFINLEIHLLLEIISKSTNFLRLKQSIENTTKIYFSLVVFMNTAVLRISHHVNCFRSRTKLRRKSKAVAL